LSSDRRANSRRPPSGGPSLAAIALWNSSGGKRAHLLTDDERTQLAVISSVVRFTKGTRICRQGDPADAIFNITSGVMKSCKLLPDGTQHIVAFLFPDDLIGLAEERSYVNSADAVTDVMGYRIPVTLLRPGFEKIRFCNFTSSARYAMSCARHSVMPSSSASIVL